MGIDLNPSRGRGPEGGGGRGLQGADGQGMKGMRWEGDEGERGQQRRVRDDPSLPRHQHASPFLGICTFTRREDGQECVCIRVIFPLM